MASTVAKKMLLVPEAEFHRLKQCEQQHSEKSLPSSTNILPEVKRPNERELVKTYMNMERMMQDPSKSGQEKVAEHVESMNDFTVFRDRVTGGGDGSGAPKQMVVDTAVEDAIDVIPPSLQSQARKLLQRLSNRTNLISWSPSGEVTIRGTRLVGSHIGDLVGDVLRSRKVAVPGRQKFLSVLAELNAPNEFVRNKTALANYQKIKSGGYTGSDHHPVTTHRPPGLPSLRVGDVSLPLSSASSSGEGEDEHELNEQRANDAMMKLKKKHQSLSKIKRLKHKKVIKWKNL